QEDVGLDTAEAVVEGVEQGPGMLVVVVGVGAPQRACPVVPFTGERRGGGQCEGTGEGGAEGGEGSAAGGEGHALPPWKGLRDLRGVCGAQGAEQQSRTRSWPIRRRVFTSPAQGPHDGRTEAPQRERTGTSGARPREGTDSGRGRARLSARAGGTGSVRIRRRVRAPAGRRVRPAPRGGRPPCRRRSSR